MSAKLSVDERNMASRVPGLLALALILVLSVLFFQHDQRPILFRQNGKTRRLSDPKQAVSDPWIPTPYDQSFIMKTVTKFDIFPTRVMIYNGVNDTFTVYNLNHEEILYPEHTQHCGRCSEPLRLVVASLKEHFPQRFALGQSPVQILFRAADSPHSQCINHPELCDGSQFAPILSFGSVGKDTSLIPSERAYPNRFYAMCMYQWKFKDAERCDWGLDGSVNLDDKVKWDDLTPQIIWRGNDFTMLEFMDEFSGKWGPPKSVWPEEGSHASKEDVVNNIDMFYRTLSPRWRAVTMTLRAEVAREKLLAKIQDKNRVLPPSWINCKFFGTERPSHKRYAAVGLPVAVEQYMDPAEMSKYKYQIDLGGGGGTTWRGTLSKLGMPGLLFHHETPTKDWFHHAMIPYVHYVPVKCDLSDLKEKFDWAEANPEEAQKISRAATKLYLRIMSKEYMAHLYDELFVRHLGEVVDAYQPAQGETVESIVAEYRENRFNLYQVATCDQGSCSVEVREGNIRLIK